LNVTDYTSFLHQTGEYRLAESKISPNVWLYLKRLGEANLKEEGINVLDARRPNGVYIDNPTGEIRLLKNDTLVHFESIKTIKYLDHCKKGYWRYWKHKYAVREQARIIKEETLQDDDTDESGTEPSNR
jgi:hypothetical protein